MKRLFCAFFLVITFFSVQAQEINPVYDAELAAKLNADEYGMKSYVLVILKSGSNKSTDKALIDSCFRGHMANMGRLVDEGKLIVAGPMGKNEKNYRGIFILNTPEITEAEKILLSDPAVNARLLEPELYKWYGSAALSLYLDEAEKIWKSKP